MGLCAASQSSSGVPNGAAGDGVKHFDVVVLGFGVSAGYFALELSKSAKAPKRVAFIGKEPVVAYERPALSKSYLFPPGSKPIAVQDIYAGVAQSSEPQGPEWYAARGWTTFLNSTVSAVDMNTRLCTVVKQGSSKALPVHYDQLVLALGQVEKKIPVPENDLDGVCYLRSEAEARDFIARVEKITGRSKHMKGDIPPPRGRVVVLGAGYLGVEVLTAMAGWGFEEVSVVILADIMLSKMAWPRVAREKMHRAILDRAPNIKVFGGCSVEMFTAQTGTRKLKAVVIDDGGNGIRMDSHVTLETELCLVCVGSSVAPLLGELARANRLHSRRDDSVVTDDTLRTDHPSRRVWAIGESTVPECGVVGARQMGAAAARSVLAAHTGTKEPPFGLHEFTTLEHHYSRFFEYTDSPIIWQSYGTFSVSPGVREAVGFGLANSFNKGFGYFWFDPRSRKVVSTFCASDGKSKLFETVGKIATQGTDIDVAMRTVYELVR